MIENIIESIKQAEQKAKEIVANSRIEANETASKAEVESRLIMKNAQESKAKMLKDSQERGRLDAEKLFEKEREVHLKNIEKIDADSKKRIKKTIDAVLRELLG
ncbi:TPA: hypothetical protein DCW38_04560 [candidate division WOR-3 bacterium]|jgi:vacuolar-type H+-ATPase subunit H|uniref:V-type ATP synthase subunit H n=1 Tax=candidate division WOR-3 bacterium TaxID=2052148 RepID=A0A350HA69_UNCW3|nr:hypothetical protein [candidate division WOR-3 bacterium]